MSRATKSWAQHRGVPPRVCAISVTSRGKTSSLSIAISEGKPDRFRDLAAELMRLKVDVLVTQSAARIRAAKQATTTIPIVMVTARDPVAAGLVDSLARPGGNITGLASRRRS